MTTTADINYDRIAQAIHYIKDNFKHQPDLETIAEHVNLSPFHFQRLFKEWAGVSPKKFMQYISVEYAKRLLKKEAHPTLFEAAHQTGLSSTGRLHDLFVTIEGMTPGEYKNEGAELEINYSFADSPFGELIIASTQKGVCHIAFLEDRNEALGALKVRFTKAILSEKQDLHHEKVLAFFDSELQPEGLKLHLTGSDFQLKVWEALLKVPFGELTTYKDIAEKINKPSASRAVGTAIGSNPIAYLIPCHRVIQASGVIGGYMWGPTRKSAIIGWEAAKINAGE
ncbi:MAG: bifunctional helix-turn-helix domain-containing protein/methylated-DNA--[protein]-cysteine S-methyltransferase [Bacteroidota bacterium]